MKRWEPCDSGAVDGSECMVQGRARVRAFSTPVRFMSLQRSAQYSSGFGSGLDPSLARRQLRVSLGVVLALAMAIVGSAAAALRPASTFGQHDRPAQVIDAAVAAAGQHRGV